MDITSRLIEAVPGGQATKLALAFGTIIAGAGGYIIAVPGLPALPILGFERGSTTSWFGYTHKSVGVKFGPEGMKNAHLGIKRTVKEWGLGLTQFRVQEGQKIVVSYVLSSPCRGLYVSADLAGLTRDLPYEKRLEHTVATSGKGKIVFTVPQTDTYRIHAFPSYSQVRDGGDCDLSYTVRWRVREADYAGQTQHEAKTYGPDNHAPETRPLAPQSDSSLDPPPALRGVTG